MLLTNPFRPDPRVHKEARTLAAAGYRVTVICWDRQGEFPPVEQVDGFEVRRLVVQSGYGVGSRQMLYLPRFWRLALKEMARIGPDIIHCHDLDTTPPGYFYARTHRLPWLFDAHEAYPEATLELRVNRGIYALLTMLEKFMTRRASHVITVGNLIAQRFQVMGGQVSIVGNYQVLHPAEPQPGVTRADLGLSAGAYLVAYIGGFNRARAIVPLLEATAHVDEVTVLLVGDGPQRADLEARLPDYPRVRYLEWVPQAQVPAYTRLADVIYYGLLGDDRNNHYSSPNALFNALIAGRPLITTNIGEVAQIVQTEQCGLVVDSPTPQAIAGAIIRLRDPALRRTMGANAYHAAETTYNWAAAEATLLKIYHHLAPLPDSRKDI
jgi:glycosyltransferase involved in cell wall biosynthesis